VPTALLRKFERYTHLSGEERELLTRIISERKRAFVPREDIVREGDPPPGLGVIRQGWAYCYKTLEDGRRQILGFLIPGDLIDPALLPFRELDHSVGAITSVVYGEVPRPIVEELMRHPRLRQALWWDWLVKLAIQREWTLNVGRRDAFERLAHLFCELYFRLEAVGMTEGTSVQLPLTQTDLAEATGLSAVHINRTLQEMRSAGLVILRDHVLTIPDLPALQVAAMFNPAYLHLDHEGHQLDANEA
jgi:CRP-like cAMP-binding protein